MVVDPPHTDPDRFTRGRQAGARGMTETRADQLRAARSVIADVAHHTSQELRAACRTVLEHSTYDEERDEAEGLLAFFAVRRGGTSCAKS